MEKLKDEIRNRMSEEDVQNFEEEEEVSPEEMAEEIQKIETEKELEEYFEDNHSIDIAESFEELDDDELLRVFELLSDENKASVLEQADEELQMRIIDLLSDEEDIDILGYMSPDDVVDILGYIDIQKSKSILDKMKRSQANKFRELLGYEEDTAGGIMTTQYIAFKQNLEIKDVMESCETIEVHTLQKRIFTNAECAFAYRESIFKGKEKDNYIITSVTFKLTKKNHQLHTQYGAIQQVLSERGITKPTPKELSDAIITIRESKLPNPNVLGNCGSFFKNPIVLKTDYEKLQQQYPEIPCYPVNETWVKSMRE